MTTTTNGTFGSHDQPGRRFAPGSNRGDQLLGGFGFLAHVATFTAVTAGACWACEDAAKAITLTAAPMAVLLLAVRAKQVGLTTTRESIRAIRDAWGF